MWCGKTCNCHDYWPTIIRPRWPKSYGWSLSPHQNRNEREGGLYDALCFGQNWLLVATRPRVFHLDQIIWIMCPKRYNTLLRVTPTVAYIPAWILTFYLTSYPTTFRQIYWHDLTCYLPFDLTHILTYYLTFCLTYCHILWNVVWHSIWPFWHSIWHSVWVWRAPESWQARRRVRGPASPRELASSR